MNVLTPKAEKYLQSPDAHAGKGPDIIAAYVNPPSIEASLSFKRDVLQKQADLLEGAARKSENPEIAKEMSTLANKLRNADPNEIELGGLFGIKGLSRNEVSLVAQALRLHTEATVETLPRESQEVLGGMLGGLTKWGDQLTEAEMRQIRNIGR